MAVTGVPCSSNLRILDSLTTVVGPIGRPHGPTRSCQTVEAFTVIPGCHWCSYGVRHIVPDVMQSPCIDLAQENASGW